MRISHLRSARNLFYLAFLIGFASTLSGIQPSHDDVKLDLATYYKQWDSQKWLNTNAPSRLASWHEAAESGIPEAMVLLGECCQAGFGVPKDGDKAFEWWKKAADKGSSVGFNGVGNAYSTGTGVTKDVPEAVKWYRKAAELGDANAQTMLGICYYSGTGVSKDVTEAVKWYRKAAELGDANAQAMLGICYYFGTGVPEDKIEAFKWYKKAADQGLEDVQTMLSNIKTITTKVADWLLVTDSERNDRGDAAFRQVILENELRLKKEKSQNSDTTARNVDEAERYNKWFEDMNAELQRIGKRIAATTDKTNFVWKFVLLENNEDNARCYAGGKVIVFSAFLKNCKNEAELAAIIGHEAAHATARHATTNASQRTVLNIGKSITSSVLIKKGINPEPYMPVYDFVSDLGFIMPYSRIQENEADRVGLIYMSKAGYEPKAALDFWRRFATTHKSEAYDWFLSTHPLNEERFQKLETQINDAYNLYNSVSEKLGYGQTH